ncbi:MAG: Xaa-Pro peptidase family protein [Alphaproteobacteria bacterium]|nr:Xaa-Pro peptidase family protein [Alphaproteobacteria bacterium]
MPSINQFLSPGYDRARVAAAMQAAGLDAALLTSPENVYYTTGYTTLPSAGNPILHMLRTRLPFFSFVTKDGHVTLFCWDFSTLGMEFGADAVIGFNTYAEALQLLGAFLENNVPPGTRLGLESVCPRFALSIVDKNAGGATLVDVDPVLDEVRLIKSPAEIAYLKRGVEIIEQTCEELYGLLRIGMGRNELTREAKWRLMKNGAEGISHLTFCFDQANPEFDIDERLDPDHLVTLDLGAIYKGYCSDNRRYAYAGTPPGELIETYGKMVEIIDGVGEAMKPGVSYGELWDLALDLFAERRLEPAGIINKTGHNIGLETEERWLDNDRNAFVREGMVINIEMYTHVTTGSHIGDEETYIIGKNGSTRVSNLPRIIRQIS